jgi:hypothetical protein
MGRGGDLGGATDTTDEGIFSFYSVETRMIPSCIKTNACMQLETTRNLREHRLASNSASTQTSK